MSVLVDSSVWVDYWRGGAAEDDRLDWLIEEGLVTTNDLILAELTPALFIRKQFKLIELLNDVPKLPLAIQWPGIVEDQVTCLRNGINKVGIPDLLIAQNARQNKVALFTMDKHFRLLANHTDLNLY